MIYGLLHLPWWGYFLVGLATTHVTIAAVTIFLHRAQAHRALELHPIISHFFRCWLWLTTGMVTKEWTAIHRKHHAKCETPEDPHSPQVFGLAKVMWEGAELYRKESGDLETLERYGQGTPDDWMERHVYTPYDFMGYVVSLTTFTLLFGIPGIIIWAAHMAWIPFFAAGVVNGIGHYFGYRNFDCSDAARNILPWGILIGGEELHNNHHTYPTSAKLSSKWWEFDIGWLYIKLLSYVGLAKVKRIAPEAQIVNKLSIDAETLKALISNKFHVMTSYTKAVLLPTLESIKHSPRAQKFDGKILRRLKSVLKIRDNWQHESAKPAISEVVEEFPALKVSIQFRDHLQDIWSRTTASQKELIDALQEWCKQAEETGIKALADFARYLKGYTLKNNR